MKSNYKLKIMYKNGSVKEEFFAYKDLFKAVRKLKGSSRRCELWYVVDGNDYRLVDQNYFDD